MCQRGIRDSSKSIQALDGQLRSGVSVRGQVRGRPVNACWQTRRCLVWVAAVGKHNSAFEADLLARVVVQAINGCVETATLSRLRV